VDDEFDLLGVGDTDLEQSAVGCSSDEHRQAVEVEGADRVAVAWSMSGSWMPCLRALCKITGSTAVNLS
jgi:hypothetical protein